MKNIVIQGLGFVGSAMAVAAASRLDEKNEPLFNVTGIDLPTGLGKERIDCINSRKFPFTTNDKILSSELKKSVDYGNLKATSNKDAYTEADIVLVSINCDLVKQNGQGKIALDHFTRSIKEIVENISEDTLVIIESTVPPGTCEKIVYPLFEDVFNKRKLNINKLFLAHSYERVMPGDEYFDSIINYWRVYAGVNDESANRCEAFLSQVINTTDYPLTRLNSTTASETGKLLENSYRAVNIAFIEEWSRFSEDVGIDLYEVINAIIIIQSDHGFGGNDDAIYLDRNSLWARKNDRKKPPSDYLYKRFGILNAISSPLELNIPAESTPVNLFRYIFNELFEDNYSILPDKSYFAIIKQPYMFHDVTDDLNQFNYQRIEKNDQ